MYQKNLNASFPQPKRGTQLALRTNLSSRTKVEKRKQTLENNNRWIVSLQTRTFLRLVFLSHLFSLEISQA